jgi:hypothetical protein
MTVPIKDLDLWVPISTGIPMDQPTSTHRFTILMPTLTTEYLCLALISLVSCAEFSLIIKHKSLDSIKYDLMQLGKD